MRQTGRGATYAPQGAAQGLFYSNSIVPVYSDNSRLKLSSAYTTVTNNPYSFLQVLDFN